VVSKCTSCPKVCRGSRYGCPYGIVVYLPGGLARVLIVLAYLSTRLQLSAIDSCNDWSNKSLFINTKKDKLYKSIGCIYKTTALLVSKASKKCLGSCIRVPLRALLPVKYWLYDFFDRFKNTHMIVGGAFLTIQRAFSPVNTNFTTLFFDRFKNTHTVLVIPWTRKLNPM
jgi:hypothetical protein